MALAELKKMHLAPQGAFFMPIRPVGGRSGRKSQSASAVDTQRRVNSGCWLNGRASVSKTEDGGSIPPQLANRRIARRTVGFFI